MATGTAPPAAPVRPRPAAADTAAASVANGRRAARRTALALIAVTVLIYFGFMLRGVLNA
jgi:hypothetical protein